MDILLLALAAFLVALLTFFSGFGLGTLLTPVFLINFPPDVAIALTGIVHLANNVFKLALVGRHADRAVVIRFGVPAIAAALLGSWLMMNLADLPVWFSYTLWGRTFEVEPFMLLLSGLLIVFAILDLIPSLSKLEFGADKLPIGGAFSGFFGGLTGNQGALRSAFLIRAGLSKEAFIGTAVVVSTAVDVTRLGMYATQVWHTDIMAHADVVLAAVAAGITGSVVGNSLLKKVTLAAVQRIVAIGVIGIAIALGAGWI